MIVKYIQNPETQPNGEPTVSVISRSMGKVASYSHLPEDMRSFIESLKQEEGYAHLLVRTVSDLNWGPNKNGDAFPTQALNEPSGKFGYKTYEEYGYWYHLHDNKDPDKSYGKVIKSVWDESMGRILVVVKVDITKDKETAGDLAMGILPKTSMGCKVAYDICSVCHPYYAEFYKVDESALIALSLVSTMKEAEKICSDNESLSMLDLSVGIHEDGGVVGIHSTPKKYCSHLKEARGRLLPTGERPFMVNLRPLFFDLSRVIIPADETSGALAKVASVNNAVSTEEEIEYLINKISAAHKIGEIEKECPTETLTADEEKIKDYLTTKIYPELYRNEEDIPKDKLDEIAGSDDIEKVLGAFFSLGMIPRPKEFQRIILVSTGEKEHANKLWDNDITFNNVELPSSIFESKIKEYNKSMDGEMFNSIVPHHILDMLGPYMGDRSYHPSNVVKRIVIIKSGSEGSQPTPRSMGLPYRTRNELEQAGLYSPGSPMLAILAGIAAFYGTMLAKKYAVSPIVKAGSLWIEKSAGTTTNLIKLIGVPSAAYLYSGDAYNRALLGEPINDFDKFMIKHTMPVALGATAMTFKGPRSLAGSLITGAGRMMKGAQIATNITKCGMDFNGLSLNDYPVEVGIPIIINLYEKLY